MNTQRGVLTISCDRLLHLRDSGCRLECNAADNALAIADPSLLVLLVLLVLLMLVLLGCPSYQSSQENRYIAIPMFSSPVCLRFCSFLCEFYRFRLHKTRRCVFCLVAPP